MQTLVFGGLHGWYVRVFGRSALVRGSDRIEAAARIVAGVVVLGSLPVLGAIGTAVYEQRSHAYVDQAVSRHTVAAVALHDSTVIVRPYLLTFTVDACWVDGGIEHVGSVGSEHHVSAGTPVTLWVDRSGNEVGPPTPTSRAAWDAVGVAVGAWFCVAVVATGSTVVLRYRLDRLRYAQWDSEIERLQDGGGRANRHGLERNDG